jgi:hypothetical protein
MNSPLATSSPWLDFAQPPRTLKAIVYERFGSPESSDCRNCRRPRRATTRCWSASGRQPSTPAIDTCSAGPWLVRPMAGGLLRSKLRVTGANVQRLQPGSSRGYAIRDGCNPGTTSWSMAHRAASGRSRCRSRKPSGLWSPASVAGPARTSCDRSARTASSTKRARTSLGPAIVRSDSRRGGAAAALRYLEAGHAHGGVAIRT